MGKKTLGAINKSREIAEKNQGLESLEKSISNPEILPKKREIKSEDYNLNIAAINFPLSPVLHKKFKILCLNEGITIKQKLIDYIRDEIKKSERNK